MTEPWTGLAGVILGAILAGGFGIYDRRSEREHKKLSNLALTKGQVAFICEIVRSQGYISGLRYAAIASQEAHWSGELYTIDATQDYLDIFECVKADWGLLESTQALKIIEFYNRTKVFLDSTKPGGHFIKNGSLDEQRSHATEALRNVERLIELGDEIVQF